MAILISINGPRGGQLRDDYKLARFVQESINILNLESYTFNLEVIVHPPYIREDAEVLGLCWGEPNCITVELCRTDDLGEPQDIFQTLAHEMIHVKQFLSGQYPYEREAKAYEKQLHRKIKRLTDGYNL